jgi:hypothetical protein
MSRGLIVLVLISLLALLIIGCKAGAPGTPAGTTGTGAPTTGAPSTETGKATETVITGDITDIDTTVSELNDSDIQDTGSLIEEVNW